MSQQVITAEQLNDLRRRVLEAEEYTKEELINAVNALVGARVAAAQAVDTASRKRPARAAKKIDLNDLLP